jgi:hypothetical protein
MNMINKLVIMLIVVVMVSAHTISAMDIRKFGLEFPHNKQDAQGNTFWHDLAYESGRFEDWSQIQQKIKNFEEKNNNWLPNPLIKNKNGKTARQEAKKVFADSGNAVSGLLIHYLAGTEQGYFNKMALKVNRDAMANAQHVDRSFFK